MPRPHLPLPCTRQCQDRCPAQTTVDGAQTTDTDEFVGLLAGATTPGRLSARQFRRLRHPGCLGGRAGGTYPSCAADERNLSLEARQLHHGRSNKHSARCGALSLSDTALELTLFHTGSTTSCEGIVLRPRPAPQVQVSPFWRNIPRQHPHMQDQPLPYRRTSARPALPIAASAKERSPAHEGLQQLMA